MLDSPFTRCREPDPHRRAGRVDALDSARAERFGTVVAALHEGVLVVGASGSIEAANPTAVLMFGARNEAIVRAERK